MNGPQYFISPSILELKFLTRLKIIWNKTSNSLWKFVSKKENGDEKQNVIPVMPLCVAVFSQTSIFFDKPVTEIKNKNDFDLT